MAHSVIEKAERIQVDLIGHALDKARAKRDEHQDNFNATGYDKYYNLVQKYDAEIDELEAYLNRSLGNNEETLKRRCEQYCEQIQRIKKDLQNKMIYIKATFPDNADLRNLEDYINDIDAWEV